MSVTERHRPPKYPLDHDPAAVTRAREAAGFTRAYVAKELEVSAGLISEIERGTRNATLARIEQLAKILGCSADELKRKSGQPPTRLAVICVECSEVWAPDHQCPNRAAKGAAA
jgi:transcriptional regulator with XRE-family HTH domain